MGERVRHHKGPLVTKAEKILWSTAARILFSREFDHRVEGLFSVSDPNKYALRAAELAGNTKLLVVVANHQSHADLIPLATLTKQIHDAAGKTFLAPYAASVKSGDQGSALQGLLQAAEPSLLRRNMELIPFVREADLERYGLPKTTNGESSRRMLRARNPENNFGYVWLPEGTVQGARKNDAGERFGMQVPPDEFESSMLNLMRRGMEVVFLPVGITGSDLIVGPDSRSPSKEALRRLGVQRKVQPMSAVTVGKPFELSLSTKPANVDVRTIVMQHIAPLVPPHLRGAYR